MPTTVYKILVFFWGKIFKHGFVQRNKTNELLLVAFGKIFFVTYTKG